EPASPPERREGAVESQRRIWRREKGSNRRRRAVGILAKRHQHVRRQKLNFHHKTALALVYGGTSAALWTMCRWPPGTQSSVTLHFAGSAQRMRNEHMHLNNMEGVRSMACWASGMPRNEDRS